MFYVINQIYIGPNQDDERYVDADTIQVWTTPARTNSSKEERIEGWCGTTNDWSLHAHGEYPTIEAATAAVMEKFGPVRTHDGGDRFGNPYDDDEVVAVFKPGKYRPMSREHTGDWAYSSVLTDITADTTDERIQALVTEYEADANSEGHTLHSSLGEIMKERREELRDEQLDEA